MWYYSYPDIKKVENLPFFLYSIGLHQLQPKIQRNRGFDYDQFFYNTVGSGVLIINNVKYILEPLSAFMIPAHVPHEYYPLESLWDVRWFTPGGYGLSDLYSTLGLTNGGVYKIANTHRLDSLITTMHEHVINDPDNGNIMASSYVTTFITQFAHSTGLIPQSKKNLSDTTDSSSHINILKNYIDYHFMFHITLDELANVIGVTPQYVCNIFMKEEHVRPTEYINMVRINVARKYLVDTHLTVEQISYSCGFENSNYFWKTFKKYVHTTPGAYRKSERRS